MVRAGRAPGFAWLVIGITLSGNVLLAALYSLARYGGTELFSGMLQYFTASGLGPVEGLILVAVGLLAARKHGVQPSTRLGTIQPHARCPALYVGAFAKPSMLDALPVSLSCRPSTCCP
jgi:hypothetical protein